MRYFNRYTLTGAGVLVVGEFRRLIKTGVIGEMRTLIEKIQNFVMKLCECGTVYVKKLFVTLICVKVEKRN
jgi:hypothetical protein